MLFRLSPSPFLLGGVIQQHLSNYSEEYAEIVQQIERSIDVDDLITGGSTTEKAKQVKTKATELFAHGTFELHKWHSNVKELESPIDKCVVLLDVLRSVTFLTVTPNSYARR